MASVTLEAQPARFKFLGQPRFWVWTVAIGLALLATYALLTFKPITQVSYDADHLIGAVRDKLDYGINEPETDPAGQRYRWLGENSLLIFPVNSAKPLKITFRMRNASAAGAPEATTSFTLNYIALPDKIKPASQFQDYTLTLVPPYNDAHRLEFRLTTAPVFKPPKDGRILGNMLQSVSIDLSETWSPLLRPGRAWLIWLLPLLNLPLLGLVWLSRSKNGLAQLAGYGAVLVSGALGGLMLLWLSLLARVGYSGELNKNLFWVLVASAAYLAAFFAYVGLAGLGWGRAGVPSLSSRLISFITPWLKAHPQLAALLGLFAVNFALTGIFYAKVWFEAGSLDPIVRHWDGPEYLFIAHGFYDQNDALKAVQNFGLRTDNYWTAHFPGYSLVLRLVWFVAGWYAAIPLLNFIVTSLFAFVFWKLLRDFKYTPHPFWLVCVSLVLPLRWLVNHVVGSSEPLMLLCQLLSIYLFKKERYWLAGIAGAAALFVRPPGIFLWVGYLLFLAWELWQKIQSEKNFKFSYVNWKAFWAVSLIPLALVGTFGIFAWRYGDFLAYFHIGEDVKHIGPIPLSNLGAGAESGPGIFYYYIFEAVGLVLLWRRKQFDIFWFGLAAFAYTLFMLYSDVLRYSIPAFPLVLAIPYGSVLTSKAARWLAVPVLIAVYLYSWGVLNINLAKLDTWLEIRNILH